MQETKDKQPSTQGPSTVEPTLNVPVESTGDVPPQAADNGAYTEEEEALVEERLKHLGYL